MTTVKPLVVFSLRGMVGLLTREVTCANLQKETFAVTTPVTSFAKNVFYTSRRVTNAVRDNLGVSILSSYSDPREDDGCEPVVIPCFHPSYLFRMGILRAEAQSLFVMVLMIAWNAAYLVIEVM